MLKGRLGYGLRMNRAQIRHCTISGILVIYHSLKDLSISGIKDTLLRMQHDGILVPDDEFGMHVLPWVTALNILAANEKALGTTANLCANSKSIISNDILSNYSTVEPDLFDVFNVKIRH